MADPITAWAALGSASAVIQVIEFGAKLIKETYSLMNSSRNTSKETEAVESLTRTYLNLAEHAIGTDDKDVLARIPAIDETRPLSETSTAVNKLAEECQAVAKDLLELISSLKIAEGVKGARRAWQSTRKAKRALQKRKQILQKQSQLRELNGQLSTAMLLHLRNNRWPALEGTLSRISDAQNENAALVIESREMILNALYMNQTRAKYLVDSLRFPEMYLRRHAIPPACKSTFEWLFEPSSPFQQWLISSNDVFWITGKAGSGKSTVMKFIATHPLTRKYLLPHAKGKKLVIAQNYLWHPGIEIQRNQEGMLREILLQMVQSFPDTVKFLPRFQLDTLHLQRPDPWSKEELINSIQTILKETNETATYCLFIDGLDEYEGEHSRLIAIIRSFWNHSNVKVCIYSRSWNVFCNAFEHLDHKIRLHELTRTDIYTYIETELGSVLDQNSHAVELMSSIADKAQGVFFWVFLVVRSLREGYEEGDGIEFMRQRVNEIPADLEAYFKHILSRVSKCYQFHTKKALSLASRILTRDEPQQIQGSNSFLSFWLLNQGFLDDPEFPLRCEIRTITLAEVRGMESKTKRYLNACCKDFLHFVGSDYEPQTRLRNCLLEHQGKVEYLHRTVYDFLQLVEIQRLLEEAVPEHFNNERFATLVALQRSKLQSGHPSHICQLCAGNILSAMRTVRNEEAEIRRRFMKESEKLACALLDFGCGEGCCYETVLCYSHFDDICALLIAHNLYTFAKQMLRKFPGFMKGKLELLEAMLGLSSHHRRALSTIKEASFLSTVCSEIGIDWHQMSHLAQGIADKAEHEVALWTDMDARNVGLVLETLTSHGFDTRILSANISARLHRAGLKEYSETVRAPQVEEAVKFWDN